MLSAFKPEKHYEHGWPDKSQIRQDLISSLLHFLGLTVTSKILIGKKSNLLKQKSRVKVFY